MNNTTASALRAQTSLKLAPPHSIESEKAVLGVCLYNPDAYETIDYLRADDFFDASHQRLFATIAKLRSAGKPIDPTILRARLEDLPQVEQVLRCLALGASTTVALPEHAKIVSDLSVRRRQMLVLEEAKHDALMADVDDDPLAMIDAVIIKLRGVVDDSRHDDRDSVSASIFAAKPAPARDWCVNGFIPCRTVTNLSGDGGTGKSQVALQLGVAAVSGMVRSSGRSRPCFLHLSGR